MDYRIDVYYVEDEGGRHRLIGVADFVAKALSCGGETFEQSMEHYEKRDLLGSISLPLLIDDSTADSMRSAEDWQKLLRGNNPDNRLPHEDTRVSLRRGSTAQTKVPHEALRTLRQQIVKQVKSVHGLANNWFEVWPTDDVLRRHRWCKTALADELVGAAFTLQQRLAEALGMTYIARFEFDETTPYISFRNTVPEFVATREDLGVLAKHLAMDALRADFDAFVFTAVGQPEFGAQSEWARLEEIGNMLGHEDVRRIVEEAADELSKDYRYREVKVLTHGTREQRAALAQEILDYERQQRAKRRDNSSVHPSSQQRHESDDASEEAGQSRDSQDE